jgi:diadenosine tetraphosphate (Ap4A) HIT family hydrolase
VPSYDPQNVFAKILRGEIPCQQVFANEYVLAFNDIAPCAPIHVLIIPNGEFINFADFTANASQQMQLGYFAAITQIAQQLGVADNFRLISNNGSNAGQTVPHFHMHLLAGTNFGALI